LPLMVSSSSDPSSRLLASSCPRWVLLLSGSVSWPLQWRTPSAIGAKGRPCGNRIDSSFCEKVPGARRHGASSPRFASVRVAPARRFTSTGLRADRWSMIKAGFPGPRRRFHASSARETSLSTDGGKPSRRMFLIIGARIKAAGPDTSILNATSRPPAVSLIV
jgi:hypothetical protein